MKRIDSEILREQLKLYFIMGTINCLKSPMEVLTESIAGGITMFQFREKGTGALSATATFELGKQLQQICRNHGVPFIVNDDIDLAIALNADGIHIGQEDAPAQNIRKLIGDDKIVGVSAHTLKEAQKAIADGADYLGIGPIYPTSSKDDARAVQGTLVIEELRRNDIRIPLVGIGGITVDNVVPILAAGADGISVISAIAGAQAPIEATSRFIEVIEANLN